MEKSEKPLTYISEIGLPARRAIIAMYPSMPIYPLLSEARLIPAQLLLDSYSKSYVFQLLTLPNCHLTKQILPISLKERDENKQSRKQPKETLIWVKNIKPKMFDQLLAQKVANNFIIDLTNGIEPIPNLGLNIYFNRNINIEAKKKILEEAKKYCAGNNFQINGSKLSKRNAEAVVYWKDKNHNRRENKKVFWIKAKRLLIQSYGLLQLIQKQQEKLS